MDIISGLSKIICHALETSDNGKTVTVTNGTNTWTATVADELATFMIPSIPVPARKSYTITMGTEFSKTIQLGYGEVVDIYLDDSYDVVLHLDFDDFKEETEDALEDIGDQLTATVSGESVPFQFGIDANGRYGYKKAGADSVTPFRTGQETFCYSLGAGRSFDIQAACATVKNTYGIDIDYRTLTAANFVAQPTSGGASGEGNVTSERVVDDYQWLHVNSYYTAPTLTYNATTGMLTISGSSYNGKCFLEGDSGYGGSHWSATKETTLKAYLIKQMN